MTVATALCLEYGDDAERELGLMVSECVADSYCPDCETLFIRDVELDAEGYHCPNCDGERRASVLSLLGIV